MHASITSLLSNDFLPYENCDPNPQTENYTYLFNQAATLVLTYNHNKHFPISANAKH